METVWLYSILSVLVVSAVSLVGVFTLSISKKTLNKALLYLISFSAGALLGDAFIHLLPETVAEHGFSMDISLYILSGIVFFFVIEKFIHWRHCHHPMGHDHPHSFAYMNLIGDAVHNFIDGLIIAAAYLVDIRIGVATTIAVALHEIPQEIGDFGVLLHGGFSRGKALMLNFVIALSSVLGVVLALSLASTVEGIAGFLVPFAAGGFIYIAGSDLIPELHKDDFKFQPAFGQLLALLLGILIMWALTFSELGHSHGHAEESHGHEVAEDYSEEYEDESHDEHDGL